MSSCNDNDINSSGSGNQNDQDNCNIQILPLWSIFGIAGVSIIIVFMTLLLGCIVLRRYSRRKSKWKNHSHKGGDQEMHAGVLHELSERLQDSSEDHRHKNGGISEETTFCITNGSQNDIFAGPLELNSSQIGPSSSQNDSTILHEFEQDGSTFRLITQQDDTYDRLPAHQAISQVDIQSPKVHEHGELTLNSEQPALVEDNERLQVGKDLEDAESHDYDDVLTSSMGPARRLPTYKRSKNNNSVYYVYIPESETEAIYTVPTTQQNTEYLNVLEALSGPSQLSQCTPGNDDDSGYMIPVDGQPFQGNVYSNVFALNNGSSSQVYSLPDEPRLSASVPVRPLRDEETYCSIGDELCSDSDIYTLPHELGSQQRMSCIYSIPAEPGSSHNGQQRMSSIYTIPGEPGSDHINGSQQRHSSIYTTIDDDHLQNETGYSYAATHALVSPKRSEEGEVKAHKIQESTNGYIYTGTHKLVSPESSVLGAVVEKTEDKLEANIKDTPNPLYAATPPLKMRGKSSTMPQQDTSGHGYENLKKVKLPPRRNSDDISFSPSRASQQSKSNSSILKGNNKTNVESKKGGKGSGNGSDEKDYFVDWDDWLKNHHSKSNNDIDSSQAYMPIMSREMYNHKYMEPQSFMTTIHEKQSLSQPTPSSVDIVGQRKAVGNRAGTVSTTRGSVPLSKTRRHAGKEEESGHDYQNWHVTAGTNKLGISHRSKSETLEHHN